MYRSVRGWACLWGGRGVQAGEGLGLSVGWVWCTCTGGSEDGLWIVSFEIDPICYVVVRTSIKLPQWSVFLTREEEGSTAWCEESV